MPSPTPLPGVIDGPPVSPARIPVKAERAGSVGGYKAVALTEGVYIAVGPALTDEPRWVNVSERGTWAAT